MGCAYAQIKNFDKAIACFENAVKYNQYDFEAYWFMGCCYNDKGDKDKQIECVKTAAELGDKKAQSWLLGQGFIKVSLKDET
jgi:tetratricopeptide (TPR) repeat protein